MKTPGEGGPVEQRLKAAMGRAARLWCQPTTEMIEMDSRLAMVIAMEFLAVEAEAFERAAKLSIDNLPTGGWAEHMAKVFNRRAKSLREGK